MFPTKTLVFLFLAAIAIQDLFGAMEFSGIDLTRHHPGRVLSLLIGNCRKFENTCPMSVEATAKFLSNIGELVLNFGQGDEHRLLAMIERLSIELSHCKDAICVMEFEKNHGKPFEVVIGKAASILKSVPEVEKFAWEQTILQPPPYF